MKKTLFLVLSGAIVIFSIICICSGPIINGVIPLAGTWRTQNCQQKADEYKKAKEDNLAKDTIESYKKAKNKCNREKAMVGLEYSSLIIDVVCGFVCTILGLLHYFDVGKPFEKVTGIIGLATGVIGFVLTLVYVIYSGYIFTKDPYLDSNSNPKYKIDGDWSFAKLEGNKYKCSFYKEKDDYAVLAKFSDLGKKQYNYNKKKTQELNEGNSLFSKCQGEIDECDNEYYSDPGSGLSTSAAIGLQCQYLYTQPTDKITNKYLFDRWVTTIIFSCFICICDIGLAIFGFLLFKSDGSGI